MENKRKDMYLQAQAGKATGWSMKSTPVPTHHPEMPAPVPMPAPMPAAVPVPEAVAAPMPVPMPVPMPKYVPIQEAVPPLASEPALIPMPKESEVIHMALGICYVPMQKWQDIYEGEEGLGRGTIFAELDLPFMGKGACRRD